jgi:hypothetical protein
MRGIGAQREKPYGIRRASKWRNARHGPRESNPARIHSCGAMRGRMPVNAWRLLRKCCMPASDAQKKRPDDLASGLACSTGLGRFAMDD